MCRQHFPGSNSSDLFCDEQYIDKSLTGAFLPPCTTHSDGILMRSIVLVSTVRIDKARLRPDGGTVLRERQIHVPWERLR